MGNNRFGSGQIGIICMVENLVGGFLPQKERIDVHCSQLWRCQLCIERIIECNNGNIFRNRQLQLIASPFQRQSEHIVTDNESGGAILSLQQWLQFLDAAAIHAFHLYTKIRVGGESVQEHGELIAFPAIRSIYILVLAANVTNTAMAQII